jgi:ABC-type multidrug transport system ATPase subunit
MIVIASIHQPPTTTFLLFDNVLLLSEGKQVYFGPPTRVTDYFTDLGHPPQPFMSPAESMLQLINTDFATEDDDVTRLDTLVETWKAGPEKRQLDENIECGNNDNEAFTMSGLVLKGYPRNLAMQTFVQLHRMGLVNYSPPVF